MRLEAGGCTVHTMDRKVSLATGLYGRRGLAS